MRFVKDSSVYGALAWRASPMRHTTRHSITITFDSLRSTLIVIGLGLVPYWHRVNEASTVKTKWQIQTGMTLSCHHFYLGAALGRERPLRTSIRRFRPRSERTLPFVGHVNTIYKEWMTNYAESPALGKQSDNWVLKRRHLPSRSTRSGRYFLPVPSQANDQNHHSIESSRPVYFPLRGENTAARAHSSWHR